MSTSSVILRRSRNPQFLHLYSKALRNYRVCSEDFFGHRYSESILNAYEVLEFFWKSIHYLDSGAYPHKHLPDSSDFTQVSSLLSSFISATKISEIRTIFSNYNPGWRPNPAQRMQPRYGDELLGTPPSQLYNFNKSKKAVKNCHSLMSTLAHIHRTILSRQTKTKILILNGKVTKSSSEIRCNQYPHADELSVSQWYQKIRAIPDVYVTRKEISQIDNSFGIIINPFGESYPEKPSSSLQTPAFDSICDYIFNGGIFVTAGGLPFTYCWDVQSGNQRNTRLVVPNVATHLTVGQLRGSPQLRVHGTTMLLDNLIEIKFNIMTTMDEPRLGRLGPVNVTLLQNQSDKIYWDCPYVNSNVNEFRSLNPARSDQAIPILRAIRHGIEVWPIAFVKHGFGILLHMGIDLAAGNTFESEVVTSIINEIVSKYLVFLK